MNYKCLVCFVVTDAERCPEHRAKWQRRFFYPCRYCGKHVKSYKAKRCNRPECFSRAMKEAALKRFPNMRTRKPHRRYTHDGITGTASDWARMLGQRPSLIAYHLSRGKSIAEVVARFNKKGGRNAR